MNTPRTSGFTLLEMTIVIALVGVVAAFTVGVSVDSIARSSVAQERDLFVTLLLRGARASALANIKGVSHGIQIDNTNHEYILFDGTTYNSAATTNRHIPYTNNKLSVSNTGGTTIIFEQLSGAVGTGAGTITLSNGVQSQTIAIRNSGQIDW